MILFLNFEHFLNKMLPFQNLKMMDFFKKGGILTMSSSTYCARSCSAEVKLDLCACGRGREEAEEQPAVGRRECGLGQLERGCSTPRRLQGQQRRAVVTFRELVSTSDSEFAVAFPGVLEAKLGKCSLRLEPPFPSPPGHQPWEGWELCRTGSSGSVQLPLLPRAGTDLPPSRLQEPVQVTLINLARIPHETRHL